MQKHTLDIAAEMRAMVHRLAGKRLPPERDLARMLGASRPTIRRVLDGFETEGLIVRRQGSGTFAAETQGAAGTLSVVGVLVDASLRLGDDPFFTRVLETLQHVLQEQQTRCLVHRLEKSGRCVVLEDGVVTIGLAGEHLIERMGMQDPPAVGLFVNRPIGGKARVSLLDMDDEDAGLTAAEYLLKQGCRRLAFVGYNEIPAATRRLAGVKKGAGECAVEVISTAMNHSAGLAAAEQAALLIGEGPLGVVAANDWLALGLHTGLLHKGRTLRQQVHIASFDGLPLTRDPSLGIQSLEVPIEQVAMDAVSELRRLCASPSARGRRIVYPMRWAGTA